MPHRHTRVPGTVTDAHAGLLRTVTNLPAHAGAGVTHLAGAIGVSRSAVSLWLEGKVGVPRPVAMLLRMLIAAQRRAD